MEENRLDVVILHDQEGNKVELEYLDDFTLNDKEYGIYTPLRSLDEDKELEVIIFETNTLSNGEEEFLPVQDEEELYHVFNEFMERMADELGTEN